MVDCGIEDLSRKSLLKKQDIQPIVDENDLRVILTAYQDKNARILKIYPPSRELDICLGIGGEWSYLSVLDWQRGQEKAVFQGQYPSSDIKAIIFACIPKEEVVTPEWLIPTSEAISLVLWIWRYGKLAKFVDWKLSPSHA